MTPKQEAKSDLTEGNEDNEVFTLDRPYKNPLFPLLPFGAPAPPTELMN
jgi:hypothetical protein